MIDSHCHLTDNYKDIGEVLKRAEKVGVSYFLNIGCMYPEWQDCVDCIEKYPVVFGAVGLHPEVPEADISHLSEIGKFLDHPKMVALGEIGLDYVCADMSQSEQRALFDRQIQIALEKDMPVIIHSREADSDMISVLDTYKKDGLKGVLHCFSSSLKLAEKALEVGFYLSASGIITFKKSQELRDIFKQIPLNRLLIETDAPYLAPVPYRGQTNEPAFMTSTLTFLSEIKGVSCQEADTETTRNFFDLFKKAEKGLSWK